MISKKLVLASLCFVVALGAYGYVLYGKRDWILYVVGYVVLVAGMSLLWYYVTRKTIKNNKTKGTTKKPRSTTLEACNRLALIEG